MSTETLEVGMEVSDVSTCVDKRSVSGSLFSDAMTNRVRKGLTV